jgi:hypothetical protein
MARLAQSMGVSGLRQAIELDLRRAYGSCLKQLGYSIEVSRRQDPANRRLHRVLPSTIDALMAGRARFAARSKRPPTTKYRIPVKPGGKIRDWYLSRAAPTSVRPMERAADNSKPAARIASSGINGNSRVATARMTNKSVRHPNVGAASPGPSLIKIGAVRNPF